MLESEQSFKRMEIVQNNMAVAFAASAFLNMGVVLASLSPAGRLTLPARVFLATSAFFGLQVPVGLIKLKSLDKKLAQFK